MSPGTGTQTSLTRRVTQSHTPNSSRVDRMENSRVYNTWGVPSNRDTPGHEKVPWRTSRVLVDWKFFIKRLSERIGIQIESPTQNIDRKTSCLWFTEGANDTTKTSPCWNLGLGNRFLREDVGGPSPPLRNLSPARRAPSPTARLSDPFSKCRRDKKVDSTSLLLRTVNTQSVCTTIVLVTVARNYTPLLSTT